MKTFLMIFFLAPLSACMVRGEGRFTGRLVDAGMHGLFFPACELEFQFGEQSSSISRASTWSREACDEFKKMVGDVVTVCYETHVFSLTDSKSLLTMCKDPG